MILLAQDVGRCWTVITGKNDKLYDIWCMYIYIYYIHTHAIIHMIYIYNYMTYDILPIHI